MTPTDAVPKQTDDPVLRLITSPIPKILWHYTDLDGFRGIVSSKQIYATNLKYLNDREEFDHAFMLAKQILSEILPPEAEECNPPVVRPLVFGTFERIFTEGALSPTNLSLFTTSFTLHGDQLSQWRGYSRGSTGVSLGFDFSDARGLTAPAPPVVFAPCVYVDDEKDRLIRRLLASYLKPILKLAMDLADMPTVLRAVEEIEKRQPDKAHDQVVRDYLDQALERSQKERPKIVNELSIKLLHVMALLKHSSFEEEQEWRFVFPVFANMPSPPQLRFRTRSSTLVPYIEFPLTKANGEFLLREVILGPGSDDASAIPSARAFLNSVGLKDVSVIRSRTPYRPTW